MESLDVKIAQYDNSMRDKVSQLHRDAFRHLSDSEEHYLHAKGTFDRSLDGCYLVVAIFQDTVVGFGSYIQFEKDSAMKKYAKHKLVAAGSADDSDYIWNYYQEYADEIGSGKPVVEFFDNSFTTGDVTPSEKDVYANATVVDEAFRGRGIGPLIVEAKIQAATTLEAPAMYVCCNGEIIERIYSKAGFDHIIRLGPVNGRGDSSLFMGNMLSK